MKLDVDKARRETPGCNQLIHFNNAGAALQAHPVIDAVIGHLRLESELGGYEAEARAGSAIEQTYESIARLINCTPTEIALVENATRAWDMAFYAFARFLGPGDRILTSVSEYASNYIAYLQIAKDRGVMVEPVPNDEYGQLSVSALETMIDTRVKLIAITHVPTNGGLINPAADVGRIARKHAIPYLLDACQSVGQLVVDVQALGCDLMSATGRKYLRGPRGTGFLYVRAPWICRLEPPFLDLHAATWTGPSTYDIRPDARRFENWESFVAGRVGLGVAVDYALNLGIERIAERVSTLGEVLRQNLKRIPGIRIRDLGKEGNRCGIVSFTSDEQDAATLQAYMRFASINVSVSSATSTLLDMKKRGLQAVVRASVHYYNTEDEIYRFCEAMARSAAAFRAA